MSSCYPYQVPVVGMYCSPVSNTDGNEPCHVFPYIQHRHVRVSIQDGYMSYQHVTYVTSRVGDVLIWTKAFNSPFGGNKNPQHELLCKYHVSKQLATTVMGCMLIGEQFPDQQHILLQWLYFGWQLGWAGRTASMLETPSWEGCWAVTMCQAQHAPW